MSEGFYSTTQCQRMLLSYLVRSKEQLATYTMCLDTDIFTTKAREWIFLILKKNYLYSKSLTSKEMFYIQMEQQLDARQEKYGKEILEELQIIYSLDTTDSIDLIVRKLEQAKVAAQLVNVMQTTHGYLSSGNVEQAIDAYKKASMQISLVQKQKTVSGLFSNAEEWLQDIRNRRDNPQQFTGLKTGFTRFDDMTGGLFPAQLTIFFGLSGKGKSTIMKNIVDRVVKTGHNVLFVPNEENKRQVETKFISLMTNIPGYLFKNGKFDDKQYELVDKFLHTKGNKGQIYIQPINQGVDATVIERQFNQLSAKGIKIDLIVVDYLDLMGSPFKTYSEWDEQAKITNSLKQLAINCNVPVVTCTQAAIQSEKEQKKDNPFLTQSQVYGAKAKVHTANTLIGLVNKTASNDIQPDTNNPVHKLVLCVCKNRDGACFAFRQNMYARTGLMVNDDEEISLTEAQVALAKQLEKVKALDEKFSKLNEKNRVNNQLKQICGQVNQSTDEDEEFLDEKFSYMKDQPFVSEEEIQQGIEQINQKSNDIQKSDEEYAEEFLNAIEIDAKSDVDIKQDIYVKKADDIKTDNDQQIVNSSSISSNISDNSNDKVEDAILQHEKISEQLNTVQNNTVQNNEINQENKDDKNTVEQEDLLQKTVEQKKLQKTLTPYELFKLKRMK